MCENRAGRVTAHGRERSNSKSGFQGEESKRTRGVERWIS